MQNLDVSTVVFAVVAIFVIFKLRSVLGTRTGAERRPLDPTTPARGDPPVANGNVIPIGAVARTAAAPPPADRWKGVAEKGSQLAAGLDAILSAEPSFTPADFLSGARAAYEMIIIAFAAGDLATLRRLLTPDALANFATAIQARKAAGQTMKTTLVSIDAADLVDARVVGTVATLAVRFAAKLVSATSDSAGAVVEGSTTTVVDHLDVWTFTRQLGARDPNWQLSATETVH
ncbi:MAG TPA: Tim44/TimA family putative adaptor protein [Roseiarcus sp.]|jgi:predicted lipid-binding transport protein (Tim44 family)